jgi:hypothetical protein
MASSCRSLQFVLTLSSIQRARVSFASCSPVNISNTISSHACYLSFLSTHTSYSKRDSNDVRKSVHHHTIQINQPTRCNSFTSLLHDVYVWLNKFRALLRPSSGAYDCTRSLRFYRWSVAVGALLVVVWSDHDQKRSNRHAPTVKPEAPSAVVRSWCWAERRPKHVEPHINVM